MPEVTEAEWTPHCDAPDCDLGTLTYECPACHFLGSEYDAWFEQNDIFGGAKFEFACEHCAAKLCVWYDSKEYQTVVSVVSPPTAEETPHEA